MDHDILLKKLDHYGIRGVANKWFQSYLKSRWQYVSISGTDSDSNKVEYGVPQGSVLGPLLFLIYINDLHQAIKFCKTRHFADDTNLLINNSSLKQIKKDLNYDLRQLCNWLKANKISLNCSKTELIIFRNPKKQLNYDPKIKIGGKKLVATDSVKYLGIMLDSHLNWSAHVDTLSTRLSRAVGMLAKIRYYVSEKTLRSIYFGIFSSILTYGSQIWGQYSNKYITRIEKIQNKAIRIINFKKHNDPVEPLYFTSKILKVSDHINLQNFLFVYNSLGDNLPLPFKDFFTIAAETHSHETRLSQHSIVLPKVRTLNYGLHSIRYRAAAFWNLMKSHFPKENFQKMSKSKCLKKIKNFLFEGYK